MERKDLTQGPKANNFFYLALRLTRSQTAWLWRKLASDGLQRAWWRERVTRARSLMGSQDWKDKEGDSWTKREQEIALAGYRVISHTDLSPASKPRALWPLPVRKLRVFPGRLLKELRSGRKPASLKSSLRNTPVQAPNRASVTFPLTFLAETGSVKPTVPDSFRISPLLYEATTEQFTFTQVEMWKELFWQRNLTFLECSELNKMVVLDWESTQQHWVWNGNAP